MVLTDSAIASCRNYLKCAGEEQHTFQTSPQTVGRCTIAPLTTFPISGNSDIVTGNFVSGLSHTPLVASHMF